MLSLIGRILRLSFEPVNVGAFVNFLGGENPYCYMPDPLTNVAWDEGRTFGGHDTFYANSTLSRMKLGLTSLANCQTNGN